MTSTQDIKQNRIPAEIILANDLQRGGNYVASGQIYRRFFDEHPTHPLRIKCLYEVADNLFYEKLFQQAKDAYEEFIEYCKSQEFAAEEEQRLSDAYLKLAKSRMRVIDERRD